MTLGQFMRRRRLQLDLTVGEAAKRAGMKDPVWSNWENDRSRRADGLPARPRPETIKAIASALEVGEIVIAEVVLEIPMDQEEDKAFAGDIERALRRIPNEKRAMAKRMIRQHAESLAEVFDVSGV